MAIDVAEVFFQDKG